MHFHNDYNKDKKKCREELLYILNKLLYYDFELKSGDNMSK